MTKRFRALKGVIRKSLIENDALGLKSKPNNQSSLTTNAPPGGKDAEQIKGQFSPIPARRFDFARSSDKIEGFMEWLDQQQKQGILEVTQQQQIGRAIENQWQNTYIRSAYQKGILRARQEMQNAGYAVPDIEDVGGINAVFNQKFHADRVGSLFTRAFNELKGITDAMDQQISRTLAEGISRGDGPEAMARAINDRVDKVGLSRARTMARTETIRAHHSATIQEYRNAGVEGVKVKAEWSTAGDSRVCFPKFMEVSTPNGDKKINDVKIGDLVSTPNGDRKVLNKSERIHKGCMTSLYFDKEGFLFSTSDHPIWSETRKDWIEAQALYPNERCQLIGDKTIEIYSVVNSKLVDPLIVQDLTIEKAHCFYVNNLLVHNCELCKPLEGHVFDLDTIEGMIPRHPNCRCCALPVDVTETEEEVGKEEVDEITSSLQQNPRGAVFERGNAEFELSIRTTDPEDIGVEDFDPSAELDTVSAATQHLNETMVANPNFVRYLDNVGMVEQVGKKVEPSIQFTNKADMVGSGVSTKGGKSLRTRWCPYSLKQERQVGRFDWGVDPVYVHTHEMHHVYGSGTEFDAFSDAMALDFHLSTGNTLAPDTVAEELWCKMMFAMSRVSGEAAKWRTEGRTILKWLNDRNPESFKEAIGRVAPEGQVEDILTRVKRWKKVKE